jgi:hypothetical protein
MDIFLSFILVLVVIGYSLWRRHRRLYDRVPLLPYPMREDADFEMRMAGALRMRLAREYMPYRSTAHTTKEIAEYAKDDPRLDILRRLEVYEYRSEQLSLEARDEIIRQV